jgi:hypothetical protein
LTRQETHSWQTDLPFLSHFTKELEACNSFGGGKREKFWEKVTAGVTIRRFCLWLNNLRENWRFGQFFENAACTSPIFHVLQRERPLSADAETLLNPSNVSSLRFKDQRVVYLLKKP